MAKLIWLTTQTIEAVLRCDPAADQGGQPSISEEWLDAAGQPAAASRFVVRPVSSAESAQIDGSLPALVRAGLVSIDGDAVVAGKMQADGAEVDIVEQMTGGMVLALANLISAASYAPLVPRR